VIRSVRMPDYLQWKWNLAQELWWTHAIIRLLLPVALLLAGLLSVAPARAQQLDGADPAAYQLFLPLATEHIDSIEGTDGPADDPIDDPEDDPADDPTDNPADDPTDNPTDEPEDCVRSAQHATHPASTQLEQAKSEDDCEPLQEEPAVCVLNAQEEAILQLLYTHPEQRRITMQCNPRLASVARERAQDMAELGYFGHKNPSGEWPNYLVRKAGYKLPTYYPDNSNSIESIAAGFTSPDAAWAGWMDSEGHRVHILGNDPFWRNQEQIGVGYVNLAGSQYVHYWVIMTAPTPE
jgi:uncharacterized protein YkwD